MRRPVISLVFCLSLLISKADFTTFNVHDSKNKALQGVSISIGADPEHLEIIGTTNKEGQVKLKLPDGEFNYYASYNGTQAGLQGFSAGEYNFETTEYIAKAVNSYGTDIEGVDIQRMDANGHYISIGKTNKQGELAVELFSGRYLFKAIKDGTEKTLWCHIEACAKSGTMIFQTAYFGIRIHDNAAPYIQGGTILHKYNQMHSDEPVVLNEGIFDIEIFPGIRDFVIIYGGLNQELKITNHKAGSAKYLNITIDKGSDGQTVMHTNMVNEGDMHYKNLSDALGRYEIGLLHFKVDEGEYGEEVVTWITNKELGHLEFILEASFDGIDFFEVAHKSSLGNSYDIRRYEVANFASHNEPLFYRIKYNFKNEKTGYSKTIGGQLENQLLAKVYPNPVRTTLHIDIISKHNAGIFIYDMNGQLVTELARESMSNEIDVSALAQGLYFVHIVTDKEKKVYKINKI